MLGKKVEFSIKIFGYLKKGSYIYPVVKLKNKIKVMNKVKVKTIIKEELEKYGLKVGDIVGISIQKLENERGQMTDHVIAEWNEVEIDTFSWRTTGEKSYMYETHTKAEELDKYFCAELFAKGITQRAEWIKADFEDKVAYLTENQYGHPALFPAWKKKQKAYKTEYSK